MDDKTQEDKITEGVNRCRDWTVLYYLKRYLRRSQIENVKKGKAERKGNKETDYYKNQTDRVYDAIQQGSTDDNRVNQYTVDN